MHGRMHGCMRARAPFNTSSYYKRIAIATADATRFFAARDDGRGGDSWALESHLDELTQLKDHSTAANTDWNLRHPLESKCLAKKQKRNQ